MEINQKAVLQLIKSAFDKQPVEDFSSMDLRTAFITANAHQILPIVYQGAYNSGATRSIKEMNTAFSLICQNVMVSEAQMYELEQIESAFENNQISYMPLKGSRLKKIYPSMDMRSMTDMDILIKVEQYESIRPIMQELGFNEYLESDHEFIWTKGKVTVELHKRLIPSYNNDYNAYFGEGWDRAHLAQDSACRYELAKEDEFIYLFTHLCKHYRDSGIGIKHFLDIWVYKNTNKELDEAYLEAEFKKLKVYDFYQNVLQTLAVWFDGAPETEKTEFITGFVFSSGSFGRKEISILSAALKKQKNGKTVKEMKADRIRRAIFVPWDVMCSLYPVLKKVPVLLPFIWVYHCCARLFNRKKWQNYNKEQQIIKEDKIETYHQALNYVGLDYNFGKDENV